MLNEESDVMKCFQDSLGNPEFCDVKIVASDGELSVSKFVLRLRSVYFRSMFSDNNNFVESQTGRVKMPYGKTALEKLITYLYSGKMDCEDLTLGSLLELMDLLNLTNFPKVYGAVEKFTKSKILKGAFSFPDCLRSLDQSSRLGLETVMESSLTHLGRNFAHFSKDEAVGTLSGYMLARLLEEKRKVKGQTIVRFRTLVTWLSFNVEADMKENLLELINLDHFTVEELASDVRKSGLYDKDRIIERMEKLYRTEMEAREKKHKKELKTMEQELAAREVEQDLETYLREYDSD